MTLLAKHEHLAADQQPVIDRAMWNMTGQAFVLSEWDVFKHERSFFIRVTSQADRIASPQRLHCLGSIERSMLLMAVATVHAPFRHFMVEGTRKLGANFPMAVVAKSRRLTAQNILVGYFLMWVMAIITGDDIHVMLILVKPALSHSLLLVTLGAHGDNLARRGFARVEDKAFSSSLHVFTPWAVAHLAPLVGRDIPRALDRGKVRRA